MISTLSNALSLRSANGHCVRRAHRDGASTWQHDRGRTLTVALHLLTGATALLVGKTRFPFVAGLLVGYAVATRPTYLLFAGWAVVDDLVRAWCGRCQARPVAMRTLALTSGITTIAIAFIAAGFATGTIGAWSEQAIRFVLEVYSEQGSRSHLAIRLLADVARDWHWLALAAILGAATWGACACRTRPFSLVAGMVATVLVSYFVQNKGFGYHRSGLIPIMTIAACIGMEIGWSAWRTGCMRTSRRWIVFAGGSVVFLMAVGVTLRFKNSVAPFLAQMASGTVRQNVRSEERDRMVSIVRAESRKGETFYQFGWNYDVAYLSELPSPSRYINGPAMTAIRADDARYSQWLAQLEEDLATRRPQFMLIDRDYMAERRPTPMGQLITSDLTRHYRVRACGPSMALYERVDRRPHRTAWARCPDQDERLAIPNAAR